MELATCLRFFVGLALLTSLIVQITNNKVLGFIISSIIYCILSRILLVFIKNEVNASWLLFRHLTMPSLAERLLCRGLFVIIFFHVFNVAFSSPKLNRCLCDWDGQQPPVSTAKCIPLNATGEPQYANSRQQFCQLAHGAHDGFCLIEILVEVNTFQWQIHPHCEQAQHNGLLLHCSEDSPYSAFNSHMGPIHTFQYCCATSDFCNNRSLSDIQKGMCAPDNIARVKQKWTGTEPTQIDKICAALNPPLFDSPHLSLILTIVIICVVFVGVSFFALFSWNRIVKYKLEYDRSCRRHESDLNNRSVSTTPTHSSNSRRNGWLVALSAVFSRRRHSPTSASLPPGSATMTSMVSSQNGGGSSHHHSSSNQHDVPLLLSNGGVSSNTGDSISFSGTGTGPIYRPSRPPSGGRRFPRFFAGSNGSSSNANRYPVVVIGPNGNGRLSPTNFENSSTVQTGDSLLPPTTNSTCNNRSQQLNPSQFNNSEFSTSGSGSGRPLLGTRTIARQIQLGQLVGKGRYGEVFSGSWVGGRVAVKVFPSREQQSWAREIEIYNALTMRHKNVLTFIAADSKDTGLTTQLWLVTSFHARGSLFDFLSVETIPLRIALRLAMGIASGVAHLHMEIPGNQGKPAIAHRDLKSKNVLVTSHLSACIADFGLAVKYVSSTQSLDIPFNLRVGTRRYMAPELLDGSFHSQSFDSYIAADLYALGLVLWEILTRTHLHSEAPADDFVLPYCNLVPPDPSDVDMLEQVCRQQARPVIPSRFTDDQSECCPAHRRILTSLGRLVVELWDKDPTVRNSALHVKKIVLAAQHQLRELHTNQDAQSCFYTNIIDPPRHGDFSSTPLTKNSSVASSAQPLVQPSSHEVSSGTSTDEDDDE